MKKLMFLTVLFPLIAFTSCGTDLTDYYDKILIDYTGIGSDDNYKEYQAKKQNGEVDPNGVYISEEMNGDEPSVQTGSIQVYFFENKNIKVEYYLDEQYTIPLDSGDYVNPGDIIYASVVEINNPHSNLYDFSGFNVFRYTDDGERYPVDNDMTNNNRVIKIDDNAQYKEIAIEPLGYYPEKQIVFNDSLAGSNGIRSQANGTWYIDNKKCSTGTVEVKSTASFAVSYEYDKDKYYYLDSEPKAYYYSDDKGKVLFSESNGDNETEEYSVDLHKYISADLDIKANGLTELRVNNEVINGSNSSRLKKLKCGDVLKITTAKEYNAACRDLESFRTDLSDSFIFTYTIPQEADGTYEFNIRKWLEKEKVSFEVKESSLWKKAISITPLGQDDEDKLLKVSNGEKTFSYKDLKNGKDIPLKEINDLEIYATQNIEKYQNLVFKVSVNGRTPQYIINKDDRIKLKFSEADTVRIDVCKGFIFNEKEIKKNIEGLKLIYSADGNVITDGQFLDEGTDVTVKAECKDGVVITGGAIKPGDLEGHVVIKADTKIKDLVVTADSDGSFVFNSSDYQYEHGKINFLYQGSIIADGQRIGKNSEITYEAASVDKGYWLPDGEHKIIVSGEDQAKADMRAIRFYKHERRSVKLVQPDYGGDIEYSVDGLNYKLPRVTVYCGSEIEMAFKPWNGWDCNYPDNSKYIVTEDENQIAGVNGKNIGNDIFTENEAYKPTLEVKLDSSIGKSISFSINASGATPVQDVIMDGTFDKTIFESKIGTEKAFTITAEGSGLLNEEKIVLYIEYIYADGTDPKNQKTIKKLPGSAVISVYDDIKQRDNLCKEINIEIKKK